MKIVSVYKDLFNEYKCLNRKFKKHQSLTLYIEMYYLIYVTHTVLFCHYSNRDCIIKQDTF